MKQFRVVLAIETETDTDLDYIEELVYGALLVQQEAILEDPEGEHRFTFRLVDTEATG